MGRREAPARIDAHLRAGRSWQDHTVERVGRCACGHRRRGGRGSVGWV